MDDFLPVDFTDCKTVLHEYGVPGRKLPCVRYKDKDYILKSDKGGEEAVSEFIASHIASSLGLPVQNTFLGFYKGDMITACQNFCPVNTVDMPFQKYLCDIFGYDKIGSTPTLYEIYQTLDKHEKLMQIRKTFIPFFWDMFILDAFIANGDRNPCNFGFFVNNDQCVTGIAPIYDMDYSLFHFNDSIINRFLNKDKGSQYILTAYPLPELSIRKDRKPFSYYDLLASGYDKNAVEAVLRVVPRIDIKKINEIVDRTPLVSKERKEFIKTVLLLRKTLILDKAYTCCKTGCFDKEAHKRILSGTGSDKDSFIKEFYKSMKNVNGSARYMISGEEPERE